MNYQVLNYLEALSAEQIMNSQTQLKRVCAVCGLEKPLAAFLQITAKQGTHYGAVCSSCRATQQTEKQTVTDDEDTDATTDKRIGAKEKVYIEQKNVEQTKDLKELYIKDSKKRDDEALTKTEDTETKEKAEKDHRKFYIEPKQTPSFLSQKRFHDPSATESLAEKNVKQQTETAKNLLTNQNKIETQKIEDIIKQELQVNTLDFSVPIIAGQTSQLRFQSDTFLKFKSWLGTSSPLVRTLDMLYQKNLPPTPVMTKGSLFETTIKNAKEEVEQYLEKRLDSPSSTKRR